jgi:hypothetical protein
MALTGPFLLAKPDFSKTEVVKSYVYTIVAPAIDYWKETMEDKKGAQLARMKAVCIFNPLHVLGNKISVSDIDGLKIFKLHEHHEIRTQTEVMKTEVMKCQALAASIKSFEERKDSKGKDTFDVSDWWKSNCATLPAFAYVLLAVLTTVTHPPLARLSVSLASEASMQLTMTIRRSLTPTTFSYPCSHSSTNEHSTSRVSRSKGEGKFREWVWGLGDC